jgi:thioredoxin-like negative regulator of GroEL
MSNKKSNSPQGEGKPQVSNPKPQTPNPKAGAPVPAEPPALTKVPPLFRRIDWITFGVTTLLVFIGYWLTLAPDLTLEDSGELAVASMYAGVPHPPGYPVWTIYTWFFTLIPFGNIAWRVALSSAVAGAFSCGLVALMVSRGSSMIIEGIAELKNIERKWENIICMVSGFVAGMLIGFNGFMWSQAVIVEVYTLSVLSLAGVLVCLLRWIYAPHQRRYLYLAFFWFGITFNNHQSLLVVAIGLEVAIFAVAPRLGRDLFFWNVIIYLGGLIGKSMGLIGVLSDNLPLLGIYHIIGLSSLVAWIYLLFTTRKTGLELARDFAMIATLGYILVVLGHITNYVTYFEYKKGLFVLFNLIGLGIVGSFIYLILQTTRLGREWLSALYCGAAWAVGAAFYVYMPLASMSNPPLNWGYPRTVGGFFHAFTRGQYERIHPSTNIVTIVKQIGMYILGAMEEFNLVYILIGLVPFLFYKRMQPRERAWVIGLSSIYLCLSLFLLILLNPAPDRQSKDLNKVFFTASHVMIAMGIGYGLTVIAAALVTQYERYRRFALGGAGIIAMIAAYNVVDVFNGTANPLVHNTALICLGLAIAAVAVMWITRNAQRPAMPVLLAIFVLMPVWPIMSHWEENEQRGHLFGYWFGHDMFTPPFTWADGKPIYPEMTRDAVLYGGTDPGRFNPTYMIFCESFIPPKNKPNDPKFDRRDVVLITQNALADMTYLQYIRAHYNRSAQIDPPFFQELLRGRKELEAGVETNIIARMVTPIDNFFLKLGDNIEKKRRAGTSYFKESDFIDFHGLADKLRSQPDALAKYLASNLSKETKDLLARNDVSASARQALSKDFNQLLEKELIYDTNRFAGIELTARTQRFIRENPQSHTRIRLNRILLEEAFPKLIAKSIGGVYPDMEIHTASAEESTKAFHEYLQDAQRRLDHDRRFPNEPRQLKPGEDVKIIDNKVQVSGQVAVMAINGLLTKVIFDANPDREFFVEESFPLDWMYPHLSPYGIIMKINRQQLPELTEDMVKADHEFWSQFSRRLIGNWITYDTPISNICAFAEKTYLRRDYKGFQGDPKFIRDNDGQKAFSKLRSSIAGVYNWRISASKSPQEQQRMLREAEFAFKQAYAFCPYSPEAVFRYINLLIAIGRVDDARLIARTSQKLDPNNGQMETLVQELDRIRQQQQGGIAPMMPPVAAGSVSAAEGQIAQFERQVAAEPSNLPLLQSLIMQHVQLQQRDKALARIDQLLGHAQADANSLLFGAQMANQVGDLSRVETALVKLVKISPDNPEAWFDLAGVQALQNKPKDAVGSLRESLTRSAQRLEKNPGSPNLFSNAQTDPRFNGLRQSPEFQQVLAQQQRAAN